MAVLRGIAQMCSWLHAPHGRRRFGTNRRPRGSRLRRGYTGTRRVCPLLYLLITRCVGPSLRYSGAAPVGKSRSLKASALAGKSRTLGYVVYLHHVPHRDSFTAFMITHYDQFTIALRSRRWSSTSRDEL
eukprot:scaffold28362_cov65-Phaeocystis_antarctica.AAC.5